MRSRRKELLVDATQQLRHRREQTPWPEGRGPYVFSENVKSPPDTPAAIQPRVLTQLQQDRPGNLSGPAGLDGNHWRKCHGPAGTEHGQQTTEGVTGAWSLRRIPFPQQFDEIQVPGDLEWKLGMRAKRQIRHEHGKMTREPFDSFPIIQGVHAEPGQEQQRAVRTRVNLYRYLHSVERYPVNRHHAGNAILA